MVSRADVRVVDVTERPTAVVSAVTDWMAFPALWKDMLDEVHGLVPKAAVGQNVMLYLDDRPSVEVGVLLEGSFAPAGRVARSALPAGRVARLLHTDGYATLGEAHRAVRDRCADAGLRPAGPRWEIYGHVLPGQQHVEVEISWLLA